MIMKGMALYAPSVAVWISINFCHPAGSLFQRPKMLLMRLGIVILARLNLNLRKWIF